MKKIKWFIGCSGFSYKEWKEEFYPAGLPASKWFDYYTTQFNTLELNVTFYRFPTLKSLSGWYDKAPDEFIFSAKVPRSITHFRKMEDTQRMLNDFYGLLKEGLKEKLGCVLFQLPPQYIYSEENLEKILTQVNTEFTNVIEFRHESWWRKDVQQSLKKQKIIFSGVSFPRIVHDEAIINGPTAYYRFHGVPRLFYSEYSEAFIENIYNQLHAAKSLKKAFVYFNNTASLAALHNARFLQTLAGNKQP